MDMCSRTYVLYNAQHHIALTLFFLYSPEPDGEWNDVDESIDLEHAEKEHAKVFKRFSEEVPKESNIWSKVWHCQSGQTRKQIQNFPQHIQKGKTDCI